MKQRASVMFSAVPFIHLFLIIIDFSGDVLLPSRRANPPKQSDTVKAVVTLFKPQQLRQKSNKSLTNMSQIKNNEVYFDSFQNAASDGKQVPFFVPEGSKIAQV